MTNASRGIVEAHLNLPPEMLERLSQTKHAVAPA